MKYSIIYQNDILISLSISNDDGSNIKLTWSELNELKINLVGDEEMFEVYPTTNNTVDNWPERHLWSRRAIESDISLLNIHELECGIKVITGKC